MIRIENQGDQMTFATPLIRKPALEDRNSGAYLVEVIPATDPIMNPKMKAAPSIITHRNMHSAVVLGSPL